MDIATTSALILLTMIGLLAIGVPMAFVSGAIAVFLAFINFGPNALFILGSRTADFLNSFALVAVPMFVLMASILERSGIAKDLYRAFHISAGNLRGGVAIVTLLVAIMLGATTGIIGGEVVLLGLIALPQMIKLGYNRKLAIGTITAGGSLGTMIPPSIILIFYGITAEVSISDLFLATIFPAFLLALLYIGYILIRCHINPSLGPVAHESDNKLSWKDKLSLFKGVIIPIIVAVVVLGSIYGGFASITESAAIGVAGTLIAAWVRRELTWKMLRGALIQSMKTCGMVFWLVFGTNSLIGIYNLLGGITFAKQILIGVSSEPIVIISVMVAVFLLLGMFIDWIGILFLTMPIFQPTLQAMGYDPIWFGIVFNLSMQIAYLTPPFGPACFYLKGVAPQEITLQEILSAQWPFIALQVLALSIVILFPSLSLWLPNLY